MDGGGDDRPRALFAAGRFLHWTTRVLSLSPPADRLLDKDNPPLISPRQIRKVSSPFRKILTGAALFVFICVTAVLCYMAAGWDLLDSIYMVVITIFGVGYGEVQPVDSPGLARSRLP